jgi:riboflavin synthase
VPLRARGSKHQARLLDNREEAQYTDAVFTGLVEARGVLRVRTTRSAGARLAIATDLGPLELGESISVQGVCLTVCDLGSSGFEADASEETLARSTLGTLPIGREVNLERAVVMGGRMGGHIVTGHVDDRARLRDRRETGEALGLTFEVDPLVGRFIAPKGSVGIDGVSLTVNDASRDRFEVVVIPHTLDKTTLVDLEPGQDANLEVDVLARYVARMLSAPGSQAGSEADERLRGALKAAGFIAT